MSVALQRGDWLTVGTRRCVVVEVFNTQPPRSACDVLTDAHHPTITTAVLDHDGWRFLDRGRPADDTEQLTDLIAQLRTL